MEQSNTTWTSSEWASLIYDHIYNTTQQTALPFQLVWTCFEKEKTVSDSETEHYGTFDEWTTLCKCVHDKASYLCVLKWLIQNIVYFYTIPYHHLSLPKLPKQGCTRRKHDISNIFYFQIYFIWFKHTFQVNSCLFKNCVKKIESQFFLNFNKTNKLV